MTEAVRSPFASGDDPFAQMAHDSVIAVAMSGGVDSSVAAARCVASGRETIGITLALWPRTREMVRDRGCCSIDAVDDARRVAARLGIRHYVWNLEHEFESAVVRDFEDAYAAGTTPNPCVRCNERIKFGALLERALAVGATHLATGHYARAEWRGDAWALLRARDARKDQSYTLHRLGQAQLARAVFPLGAVAAKEEVRAEARGLGLVTAAKPESQDLCFVDGSVHDDLRRRLAGRYSEGPVVDASGAELGRHPGLPFFTVGQRSGLGLAPATPDARPLRVLELRPADNAVVVGPVEQLQRRELHVVDSHWTATPPRAGDQCLAQLRAHGEAGGARVLARGAGTFSLRLAHPSTSVSPGQSVVLYAHDVVLGGGVIARAA